LDYVMRLMAQLTDQFLSVDNHYSSTLNGHAHQKDLAYCASVGNEFHIC
jgi:hypothetical protein